MSVDRRLIVGASDIAAILNVDPFLTNKDKGITSSVALHRERLDGVERAQNEDMSRGKHLEPGLCSWYCEIANAKRVEGEFVGLHGVRGLTNSQLNIMHPSRTWARATPDMVVRAVPVRTEADGPMDDPSDAEWRLMVVDVKCPRSDGKKVGDVWVRTWVEKDGTAPLHYRLQSLWQTGVARAAGVPVFGAELAAGPIWGRLQRVFVEFDAEWFDLALERAEEWLDCVRRGVDLPSSFHQQPQQGEAHV